MIDIIISQEEAFVCLVWFYSREVEIDGWAVLRIPFVAIDDNILLLLFFFFYLNNLLFLSFLFFSFYFRGGTGWGDHEGGPGGEGDYVDDIIVWKIRDLGTGYNKYIQYKET